MTFAPKTPYPSPDDVTLSSRHPDSNDEDSAKDLATVNPPATLPGSPSPGATMENSGPLADASIPAHLEVEDLNVLHRRIKELEASLVREISHRRIYQQTLNRERNERSDVEIAAADKAAVIDVQLTECLELYRQSQTQVDTLKSTIDALRTTNSRVKQQLILANFDIQQAREESTKLKDRLNHEFDSRTFAERAFLAQGQKLKDAEDLVKRLKSARPDQTPSPSPPPQRPPTSIEDLNRYARPRPIITRTVDKPQFRLPPQGDIVQGPSIKMDFSGVFRSSPGSPFYQPQSSKPTGVSWSDKPASKTGLPLPPPGLSAAPTPDLAGVKATSSKAVVSARGVHPSKSHPAQAETVARVYVKPSKSTPTSSSVSILKATRIQPNVSKTSPNPSSSSSTPLPVIDLSNDPTTDEEGTKGKMIVTSALKRGQETAQVTPVSMRRTRPRRGDNKSAPGAQVRLGSPEVKSFCEVLKAVAKHPNLNIASTPPAIPTPARSPSVPRTGGLALPRKSITIVSNCPTIDVIDPIRIPPQTPRNKAGPSTRAASTPSSEESFPMFTDTPPKPTTVAPPTFDKQKNVDLEIEALFPEEESIEFLTAMDVLSPSKGKKKAGGRA